MDCLARNLGLDIEALARSLAMNNDGRKPIQCLDVDEDHPIMQNNDESKDDEPTQNFKLQKVNESDKEESKEPEQVKKSINTEKPVRNMPIETEEVDDFLKDSRQPSYKTCNSGDALMIDESKPAQKLTPINPMKEISPSMVQK